MSDYTARDINARLDAPDLYTNDEGSERAPTTLDALAEDVIEYINVRDLRGNDLDGAESDARALGFSGRAEWESALRVRALTSLYAAALDAIPNHGTDAAWEAERSDIEDDDLTGGRDGNDQASDPLDFSTYLAELVISLRDQLTDAD